MEYVHDLAVDRKRNAVHVRSMAVKKLTYFNW
jgi:hypothetical protein